MENGPPASVSEALLLPSGASLGGGSRAHRAANFEGVLGHVIFDFCAHLSSPSSGRGAPGRLVGEAVRWAGEFGGQAHAFCGRLEFGGDVAEEVEGAGCCDVEEAANLDDLAAHFVNSALLRAKAPPEQMYAAGRGATSVLGMP